MGQDCENCPNLKLTSEWDKIFKLSDKVNHQKITFHNRFGIFLAGDLYEPKDQKGKMPAIAVCGPFGAVKEQASGLYAMTMAERGFVTLAFDPSFTGESGGQPRFVCSPDANTDDFSAAVDYLSLRDNVDPEKIGIIGICGWGGFALNCAAQDPRIKAIVTSTMYDMSRVTALGYNDSTTEDQRYETKKQLCAQRLEDYKNKSFKRAGGLPDKCPEEAPLFIKQYWDFYKTPRGYHKNALSSTDGWNVTSSLSLMNTKLLEYANEIRSPVLMIHGELAHSLYMSKTAYEKLKVENKELMIIPGAYHCDLYDNMKVIPFDKITEFMKKYLA